MELRETFYQECSQLFVDIGEDKNAFIHIKDVIPKVSNVTGNKDENLENIK